MNIPYNVYARIKDKVCIAYLGHCADYVVLLRLVRPIIAGQLSPLKIFLCCRDELLPQLEHEENVIPMSRLNRQHNFFGYVKMISGTMKPPHPIEMLLRETGCSVPVISKEANVQSHLCCLFTNGDTPTVSLNAQQIEKYRSKASFHGFDVWVNPDVTAINEAGWVIGVESVPLFESAARGIKTSLIPTGIGTKVYQLMFPSGEILNW